eukprot:gene4904-6499_t
MAVIEAARNLAGVADANSSEFGATSEPVVGLMTEWMKGNELEIRRAGGDLGGTMRLGAFDARLVAGSKIAGIYGSTAISERHRHRYEVNMAYRERLESKGMVFCGTSPDGLLPETVEYKDHPWFIGLHRCGARPEPVGIEEQSRRKTVPDRRRGPICRTVSGMTPLVVCPYARHPGRAAAQSDAVQIRVRCLVSTHQR